MDEACEFAMSEQLDVLTDELAEMTAILSKNGRLSRLEYRAAERIMQVLIACKICRMPTPGKIPQKPRLVIDFSESVETSRFR